MAEFPNIPYEIIPAGFKDLRKARRKVQQALKLYQNTIVVGVGFTAPYFMSLRGNYQQIWCINGIPEESLLHSNSLWKRLEVFFKWKSMQLIFSPEVVITVSKRMKNFVQDKFPNSSVLSIPLCADLKRFSAKPGLEKNLFTYSGSGAPWQNLGQLSEVWGKIYELAPDSKFRVISRDPRAQILGKYLPNEAIEFVGTSALDELAFLFQAAEVGFLLRKDSLVNRVSFPTKLSEYLASGAWVVVSEIDWDVADWVEKYQAGILVSPESDSKEIAQKILQKMKDFRQDQKLTTRLHQAALELGKSNWLKRGHEILENTMALHSGSHK